MTLHSLSTRTFLGIVILLLAGFGFGTILARLVDAIGG